MKSLFATILLLQSHPEHISEATVGGMSLEKWFGLLELPFLIVCVFFAFKTAAALKGGVWGKGMTYLAWGFLVMAVGHLSMQLVHHYQIDIFKELLGQVGGTIAWFTALIVTWGLSALGFYSIYKISKGPK